MYGEKYCGVCCGMVNANGCGEARCPLSSDEHKKAVADQRAGQTATQEADLIARVGKTVVVAQKKAEAASKAAKEATEAANQVLAEAQAVLAAAKANAPVNG